jgi:hypothetical protein
LTASATSDQLLTASATSDQLLAIKIVEKQESETSESAEHPISLKAWLTLAGGTLVMILPGSIYVTGNLTPYIASYFSIPITETQNMLPSFFVLNCFFMPIGSKLAARNTPPKLMIPIGCLFGCAVLYAATYVHSFALFWFLYILGFAIFQMSTYMQAIH